MVKKFTFWLEGIVEDEPLPDEIQTILFIVKSNGIFKYLEMQGFEKEINHNAIIYRPLEAEFFSLREISNDGETLFLYKLKTIIDEAFFSPALKQQFKNRRIYLKHNTVELLFKIN